MTSLGARHCASNFKHSRNLGVGNACERSEQGVTAPNNGAGPLFFFLVRLLCRLYLFCYRLFCL
jgi:hypothetical protein